MKIRLFVRAEIGIDESALYYDIQKTGLGSDFLIEVEKTCALILRNPKRYNKNPDGFREAPIHRFPFYIIYRIFEDKLYVFSVFHSRRNPSVKLK